MQYSLVYQITKNIDVLNNVIFINYNERSQNPNQRSIAFVIRSPFQNRLHSRYIYL